MENARIHAIDKRLPTRLDSKPFRQRHARHSGEGEMLVDDQRGEHDVWINTKLRLSSDETIERVLTALKVEGFGVLSDIDVQYAMKEKLGVDMSPYRILCACNPPLAYRALQAEPDIGVLPPCNVVVRQDGERHITVASIDPLVMMEMVDKPEVLAVAKDAGQRLRRICDALIH